MSDELKPCAHCGGKAHTYHNNLWHVACNDCRCRLVGFATEAEAIAAWNTRADDVQIIENAENYKLADDSRPQVIATSEKHELADSREELEADIREWIDIATYKTFTPERMLEVMLHWLDRQAAITEREVKERVDFSLITQVANALFPDYQEQVEKLTAERDELRDIIDHMPKTEAECEACQEAHDRLMFNAKLHEDELRGKLAEKQRVCDIQRESFLKLERENAELRRMLADAARAILDECGVDHGDNDR